MTGVDEGDNFRKLGKLEPHPEYKGVFVYVGSNLQERSFRQILRDLSCPISEYSDGNRI